MSELLRTLEQDLAELQRLATNAGRRRTQELLNTEILKVTAEINEEKTRIKANMMEEEPTPTESRAVDERNTNFVTVTKYSWDQESDCVKIYLSLDGIGAVDKNNLRLNATERSIDLQIFGYRNQNYRFGVRQLEDKIVVGACKLTQKTNTVIIRLKKEKSKSWDNLEYKENKLKTKKADGDDGDDQKDPTASLMDMMKNLYETGDENMKRTIAEAWTKSADDKKHNKSTRNM